MGKRRLSVRGLVAFQGRVRRQAARGLNAAAAAELHRAVTAEVARVDALCAAAGVRPADLPAPSRNAYRFLCTLEPARLTRGAAELVSEPRFGGLVASYDRVLADLAAGPSDLARLAARIGDVLSRVERSAVGAGLTIDQLPARSRTAYEALADLATPGRLAAFAECQRDLRGRLAAALAVARPGAPLELALRLKRTVTLWRWRERRRSITVTVSDAFVGAPPPVLDALVGWCVGPGRRSALVEDWLEQRRRPPPARSGSGARGVVHDLGVMFEGLNRTYFASQLTAPVLAWTAAPTAARFGHYSSTDDRVVLSVSLDAPVVPAYVVEFVLYHELLHKERADQRAASARHHDREFRRRERLFPRYAEASAELERLARVLRA